MPHEDGSHAAENERLADQLRKAEIVIDVQKKVAMLLGRPLPEATQL